MPIRIALDLRGKVRTLVRPIGNDYAGFRT